MANPKALPDLPAILPTGDLDCDADPGGEVFAELMEFSTGLPEVLATRRRKAAAQREREESAVAVARAAAEARLSVHRERGTLVSRPKPKPSNKRKALTPEEKRMKKIRGLLSKFRECPPPEDYCHWMDRAKIELPELCRGVSGVPKDYRDAYKTPKFAAAIRSEKSRAWSGISS
jgi:hypothetical protein